MICTGLPISLVLCAESLVLLGAACEGRGEWCGARSKGGSCCGEWRQAKRRRGKDMRGAFRMDTYGLTELSIATYTHARSRTRPPSLSKGRGRQASSTDVDYWQAEADSTRTAQRVAPQRVCVWTRREKGTPRASCSAADRMPSWSCMQGGFWRRRTERETCTAHAALRKGERIATPCAD